MVDTEAILNKFCAHQKPLWIFWTPTEFNAFCVALSFYLVIAAQGVPPIVLMCNKVVYSLFDVEAYTLYDCQFWI